MQAARSAVYRVKRGDCLWSIAKTQFGNPQLWVDIARANRITNPRQLLVGMDLRLFGIPVISRSSYDPHANAPRDALSIATPMGGKLPLDDDALVMRQDMGEFIYELKPSGELTVGLENATSAIEVNQKGEITGASKAEYENKLVKMSGQFQTRFDPAKLKMELSCGFTEGFKDAQGRVIASTDWKYTFPNIVTFTYQPGDLGGRQEGLTYSGKVGFELKVIFKGPTLPDPPPLQSLLPAATLATIGTLSLSALRLVPLILVPVGL